MHEVKISDIVFSNNRELIQPEVIHAYLSKESYWAENIPMSIVQKAIQGSVCFGAYLNGKQIAFARVITDEATFAYLADVFVLKEYRGIGISKKLMNLIMSYPAFKKVRRFMLATKDAHSLYEEFGFKPLSTPGRFMELKPFEKYSNE